ncbi:hypothetical protein D5H75_01705 [Bailinhaonella thermotolerans]|uniref:Signal transduction histidine kinase subgroup 3 dimerisation and phosphoacceptor domain-containing protein n=2 Tax=Bailinhaonella thermotolerans TaxID=1070861 RepID=A0A3A4B4M6_9ACTN|nr:hypothetical protein D5H75_01705 [Bailinhaonella thermotolerans]
MLRVSFGVLFLTRLAAGLDDGIGPVAALLPLASCLPLGVLLARRWSGAVRHALLAAVVLLYAAPFAVAGGRWDWAPWTVAAAVLCALPGRVAWPLFVLVVVGSGGAVLLFGHGLGPGPGVQAGLGYMIVAANGGLILFVLSALVRAVEDLHGTREEPAGAALARERLRLDAELRDPLGGNLRALASRMRAAARAGPGDARRDLREGVALARQTLARVRAAAAACRAGPAGEQPRVESPRLARRALPAVLALQCVLVMRLLALHGHLTGWRVTVLAAVLLAAVVVLEVLPRSRTTPAAQGLLIVLPLAFFPGVWDRLLGVLTGKLLLTLRPPRSWALAGVVPAGHLAWLLHSVDRGDPLVFDGLAHALTVFGDHLMIMWLVYCLGRLSGLLASLERARHELAVAAVRGERTRVAGDLHDVLGFSLSAVALKGELADRLLDTDPARARSVIAALVPLVERTLAELGSIAADRVDLRLAAELDSAREVLRAAGVEVAARCETGPLPAGVCTAVAAALRECVTNVLRHSRARACEISVSASDGVVRLRVANDGAPSPVPAGPGSRGSGLGGLAHRTGGRLTAGHRPGGRFEVVAEFPAAAHAAPRGGSAP